eukprot:3940918-Rhodomonas_salina.2
MCVECGVLALTRAARAGAGSRVQGQARRCDAPVGGEARSGGGNCAQVDAAQCRGPGLHRARGPGGGVGGE